MRNAVWVVSVGLLGCGAAASSTSTETQASTSLRSTTTEPVVTSQKQDAIAYDATGEAKKCEKPEDSCTTPKMNSDLQTRCVLAGFRMAQCGCEMWCMGKPGPAEKTVYDADGNAKACAKPMDDCSPPPARAAFQDACTDKGHRLETCGCEWLCSGNPTK